MNQQLQDIYEDPSDSGSYGGIERLLTSAKDKGLNVSREQVEQFLKSYRPYTLHRVARKHYSRNPTVVSGIDAQWQADLVDMQQFSKTNRGIKYLLTVIDCFSKFAWAIPIKDKTGKEITDSFKQIFTTSGRTPKKLQTDKGKEFLNKTFQEFLKSRGVEHFVTQNETKAAIVERFNRTLKTRMWTYFSTNGTDKYVDIIQSLVDAYNNSVHRSIGMRPSSVRKPDEQKIFQKLYAHRLDGSKPVSKSVGPYVRISKVKRTFEKGYRPNWTGEVFKVKQKIRQPSKSVLILEDLGEPKEVVKGRFYPEEVQTVKFDEQGPFPIERIVKTRVRKGIKEHLVKWMDYPESQNSWVPSKDIQKI